MVKQDISSLWTLYRFGSWVPDIALELCDARAQLVGREIVGPFCTQQLVEVLPRCQRVTPTAGGKKKTSTWKSLLARWRSSFPNMTIFPIKIEDFHKSPQNMGFFSSDFPMAPWHQKALKTPCGPALLDMSDASRPMASRWPSCVR